MFEQHDGYFDLPHIDLKSVPVTDFPLYAHWSYDRIYRNDLIKQPDVLMFLFLYNQDFSFDVKKINYEFYEPRCIYESSLSPSIHSILASELGKDDEALGGCFISVGISQATLHSNVDYKIESVSDLIALVDNINNQIIINK